MFTIKPVQAMYNCEKLYKILQWWQTAAYRFLHRI